MFLGDTPEEVQSEVRGELGRVSLFFEERYNAVAPDFTLYFSEQYEPVASMYRDLYEREAPIPEEVAGGWVEGYGGMQPDAFVVMPRPGRRERLLAHEYYHVLQHHVLSTRADSTRSAPGWLIEGSAAYVETHYYVHRLRAFGRDISAQAQFDWELVVTDIPFVTVMGNDPPPHGSTLDGLVHGGLHPGYYEIAGAAVSWLVTYSGNDRSHVEFWLSLAETDDWQSSFASTFNITAEGLVEALEAHRDQLRASVPTVSGVVVDLDGEPVSGATLGIRPRGNGSPGFVTVAEDGTFAFDAPEGRYFLDLLGNHQLSVDPETGEVNKCGPLTGLEVPSEGRSGLVIRFARDLLVRQTPPLCNEGPNGSAVVSGVVLGPDARPAPSIIVCGVNSTPEETVCTTSGEDGTFELRVRGAVWLSAGRKGGPTGWYGKGSSFTSQSQRTAIRVQGGDVQGIEIRLPAFISGTVVVPGSNPPASGGIIICAEPTSPDVHPGCARMRRDGTFKVAAAESTVWLRLFVRGQPLGWYGDGGFVVGKEERAPIQVSNTSVEGIEIHLSSSPP